MVDIVIQAHPVLERAVLQKRLSCLKEARSNSEAASTLTEIFSLV